MTPFDGQLERPPARRVTLVRIAVYAPLRSAIVISCHSRVGQCLLPYTVGQPAYSESVSSAPRVSLIIGDDHGQPRGGARPRAPRWPARILARTSSPRRRPSTGRSCIRSCRLPSGPVVVVAMRRASRVRAAADRRTHGSSRRRRSTCSPSGCARSACTAGVVWSPPPITPRSAAMPGASAAARRLRAGDVQVDGLDPAARRTRPVPPEEPESVPGAHTGTRLPRGRASPCGLRRASPRWTHGRSPAALVATASVCQEVNDLESAARDLDEALALAPELGRGCTSSAARSGCALDDMEAAARCFRQPRRRGCRGSAARGAISAPRSANWTARPRRSTAFEHLLALDPSSPQAHNNVGVVSARAGPAGRIGSRVPARDRTRAESGVWLLQSGTHALPAGALSRRRGRLRPGTGARSRAQSGSGHTPGAVPAGDGRCSRGADASCSGRAVRCPAITVDRCSRDTSAVLWALVTHKPDLAGWQSVHEWLNGELAQLA